MGGDLRSHTTNVFLLWSYSSVTFGLPEYFVSRISFPYVLRIKKPPLLQAAFSFAPKLLLGFALLIGNAAAGFASGLAGSLAFAATALAGAEFTSLQSFDMFHVEILHDRILL